MATGKRRAGNLPLERTRLVGRRRELAWIARACGRSPLVTLTGVGGVGKTRLALQASAELQHRFRDGAWLVDLSPLSEGALVAHTIAEALPLADQTTRPVIDVLADYLAGRELLLVLDTCEHLVDACSMTAEALLRAAPGLRILATSRRVLGVVGEQVWTVDPLPVPATDDATDVAGDAVVLLVERAAEAVPGFALTDANRADVVRLCRRLEGLPLALELAAARLPELSVGALAERLEDRFAVLGDTDGAMSDAVPPWHRALRTAIGWSHELCSPPERLLWARLSVFAGSFEADMAREVCADSYLLDRQIPALLGALADKSLLTWQPTGGGERYRMLDTIREFGAHWLRALGEEGALRRCHRDHYRALARRAEAAWLGPDQLAWYDRMRAEHDNLRAALEFCLAEPEEGHLGLELSGALWFFWYGCGFGREGRHYLEAALAQDSAPSRARNRALWACGLICTILGDAAGATARAAECVAAAEQAGDADAAAIGLATVIAAAAVRGDQKQLVEAWARLRATPRSEDGGTLAMLVARAARGHGHTVAGETEAALTVLEQARTACQRLGERWFQGHLDSLRAQAELARGRFQAAQECARAALKVQLRLHDNVGTAMALDALAAATAATGQNEHAAYLLGMAQQLWETLGRPQLGVPDWVAARERCEMQARSAIGDHAYEAAFHTGYHTDTDSGLAHALKRADVPPGRRNSP